MGKEDRDWYRGKHPAYCTCVKCHPRRISLRNIVPWRPRPVPPTQPEEPVIEKPTPEPNPRVEEPVVEEPVTRQFAKDDSPRSTARRWKPPLVPGGVIGGVWLVIPRAVRKLLLSCLVLALLGAMVQLGSLLFTHQVGPMPEALIFIGEAVTLFIAIWVIRSYKYRGVFPHFGTVLLAVTTVIVVLAFAGVEPLSTYKDDAWSWVNADARPWIEERVSAVRESVDGWVTTEPSGWVPKYPETPQVPQIEALPMHVMPTLPTLGNTQGRVAIVTQSLEEIEKEVVNLINQERAREGLNPTVWNNNLYRLSKSHTIEMADRGELFHSSSETYGENAWGGGKGYYRFGTHALAKAIVESWMSSPLHRAWILHIPLRVSVVSIVDDGSGQWASWTFRFTNDGGPPLIQKAYNIYLAETRGRTPWLEWLYDVKGYPENTDWLLP
ncbi:MAG: CAP domain-containing protein [Candidatus Bathyanammoxibius sp.]